MNKKNLIIFIVICLFFTVLFSFSVYQQNKIDFFYGYDPFFHFQLSKGYIETGEIVDKLVWTHEPTYAEYPSLMRIFASELALVLDLSLITIYKYVSFFFTFLTAFFLFLGIRRLTQKNFSIIILPIFFILTYILWRSLLGYPEDMALFFISLILFSYFIKDFNLGMFSFIFLIMTHMPSAFVAVIFLIPLLLKQYKENKTHLLLISATSLILIIPVLHYLFQKIRIYLMYHLSIFHTAEILQTEVNPARYAFLTFADYQHHLGFLIPLCLISVISFIFLKEKKNKLLPISFFLLVLMTTGFLGLFSIPYYRMLGYLSLIVIVLSVDFLVDNKKFSLRVSVLILSLLIILSSLNILAVKGNLEITNKDIQASNYLLNTPGVKISLGPTLQNLRINNTETDWGKISKLFTLDFDEFKQSVKREYPDDSVWLYLTNEDIANLNSKNEPLINQIMRNYPPQYENSEIKIYKLK